MRQRAILIFPILKESIQHEVQGLAQLMEVECGFPGMENHEFTYDTFIS